jgi:hypothetical protein
MGAKARFIASAKMPLPRVLARCAHGAAEFLWTDALLKGVHRFTYGRTYDHFPAGGHGVVGGGMANWCNVTLLVTAWAGRSALHRHGGTCEHGALTISRGVAYAAHGLKKRGTVRGKVLSFARLLSLQVSRRH